MDATKFNSSSPGTITKIATDWGQDHSFIPHLLPPAFAMSDRLWKLLTEAKHQIGILEGLGRTLPNPAILLRPVADREAIQSSRLEGTYASPRELLLFELDQNENSLDDHREVFNYRKALNHGTASDLPISLRLIRDLHRILLTGVRGKEKTPGEFRKIPVGIGSGGRFIPPPPEYVMSCLDPLERYFHNTEPCVDPLIDCFLVHYQFETIHPFIDGNGRVGRLLLAIMLQQKCNLTKPWLYMSEFYEASRDDYVGRLFNVSSTGSWAEWIEYCLQGTTQQARDTISRCERLVKIRDSFMSKLHECGGSIRLKQIVDDVFHSPFVRIADLPARLDVTYPTARADVERLVDVKILRELPTVRPKTYYAPEVFNVAYEKLDNGDILT